MPSRIEHLNCANCQARSKSVFCDLMGEDLDLLNDGKGCSAFKKGQVVFHEGGYPQGLYCINSGKIKISKTGDEGKEQIVRFAKEGNIMGYRALLSGEKYSCSASVIEDSNMCFIPRDVFFKLVKSNVNLSMQVMKLLSEELRMAESRITDLAQKPVRERVAEALLFLKETYGFEDDGKTINVVLSREEIANVVGTATETAIRLLSEFKHDGIVDLTGKKIVILNLQKLIKTANIYD